MNYFDIGILFFLAAIVIIELIRFACRHLDIVKRARLRRRIKRNVVIPTTGDAGDIEKHRQLSDVPLLNRLLRAVPTFRFIDRLLVQANARFTLGFFILLCLLLGMGAFWWATVCLHQRYAPAAAGCVVMLMPFVYLLHQKRRRMAKFQSQLPEAVDLMARALKAGHALSGAMKLVSDEFGDPIGTEFDALLGQINFGVAMADALKGMTRRVVCQELNYFVVAVILQRETGGNLAELLERLADLMRKNFEFNGKVRTLSSEGRFSSIILVLVPFLLALFFQLKSPGYLTILTDHPIGRMMLGVCGGLMVLGILVLRKMVDIKV